MPFDLSGSRALVTGAGAANGIGFATARMLSEMGASVLLAGAGERVHERAAELRRFGADAYAFEGDLTTEAAARELAEQARAQLEGLDILINNAGMTSSVSASADTGEAADIAHLGLAGWHASLARNLDTAFLVTKHALPLLRASAHPRVVMVASVTGPLMAMRGDAGYAAAKSAMVGLARAIALDEASHGICVNAVAPGWIATESQTAAESLQGTLTPVGRSATAAEVAAAICFLASREASYVTGQVLVVDGGNSIAEERG